MAVRLVCPSCSAALSVKDEYAGRAVKCPKCGGVIPASQPTAPSKPAAALPPPPAPAAEKPSGAKIKARPTGKPVAKDDAPPANREGRDTSDDERPTRNKRKWDEDDDPRGKKKGGSNVPLIIGIVGGVLLAGCGGLGYLGYVVTKQAEQKLNDLAEEPEQAPGPIVQRPTNDRVTAPNFQKLKPLMTQAEVEAVLGPGAPAHGFDVSGAFAIGATPRGVDFEWEPKANAGRVLMWESGPDRLFVAFHDKPDAGGKLQMKMFVPKGAGVARSGEPDDDKFAYDNPQLAKGGPAVEVSAADLAREAATATDAARTKYADKRLAVTGTVLDFTEDQPDVEVQLALTGVVDRDAGRSITTRVTCQIKIDAERRKSYALSRGQTVTVSGTCTQVEKHFVTLSNSSIKSTGPDPAARPTLAALAAELRADHTATETRYKGKEVTLVGVVVSTQAYIEVVVSVGGKESDSPLVKVACSRSERVAALKPGDRVTVKGRFQQCTLSTVDLEQGWVVP